MHRLSLGSIQRWFEEGERRRAHRWGEEHQMGVVEASRGSGRAVPRSTPSLGSRRAVAALAAGCASATAPAHGQQARFRPVGNPVAFLAVAVVGLVLEVGWTVRLAAGLVGLAVAIPAGAAAAPPPAACPAPEALAASYRKAVLAGDAETLVGLIADGGLACMDHPVPKAVVAHDLRRPGNLLHALLFDSAWLRRREDRSAWRGDVSLADFLRQPGVVPIVTATEPTLPGATRRVMVRFEGPGTDRPDAFVDAHCVAGRWLLADLAYACYASPEAWQAASSGAARPGGSPWTLPAGAETTDLQPGVEPGQEQHRDVPACRDFRLTAAQALAFFRQARVIDRHLEAHQFNWAPCLMTGLLRWPGGTARWRISAFLVGEVRLPDAQVVLLGCDGPCKAAVDAAAPGKP